MAEINVNEVNESLKSQLKTYSKKSFKTLGKITLAALGAYILYRFGKAVGHAERDVKLADTLFDIAHGSDPDSDEHISVTARDGSKVDLEDALVGTKADDLAREFVSPSDVLRIAQRNVAKW